MPGTSGLVTNVAVSAFGNHPYTRHNKIENGSREITIEELERFASNFKMTIDHVIHFDAQPVDVTPFRRSLTLNRLIS